MTSPQALVLTPKLHGADGVSAVSRLIVGGLAAEDMSTRVLVFDDEPRRDLVDFAHQDVIDAAGSKLRYLREAWRHARATDSRVVVATHLRMLPAAVPFMQRGVPVATYLHGVECWRPLSALHRRLLERSDVLMSNSAWTRRRFLESNPSFAGMPISICHPGIPVAAAAPTPPTTGRAIVVGRLWSEERYKGHDVLIDIWPQVTRLVPQATLTIVGDGDDRPRLEARVRGSGLTGVVTFTGLLSRAELLREFADAQLLVLPSSGEGFGVVFLEAMAAGRACIAATGAAEEVVVDGVTGRIVPQAAAPLMATLVELLGSPERCAAMGAAGRHRVETAFSERSFARALADALASIHAAC